MVNRNGEREKGGRMRSEKKVFSKAIWLLDVVVANQWLVLLASDAPFYSII